MTKSAIITAALLFGVSSHGSSQTQSSTCAAIAPTATISEIGAFSDMRYTAEHAYGHTVLLWRSGNCVFGFFESAQGLAGDTPIGELQDVKHNRNTGKLSFSAKLTIGVVTASGSNAPRPSRDLFSFDGSLGTRRLMGALTYVNQDDAKAAPVRNTLMLTASARDTELMRGSATYGAWREYWQPILKRRGPRW